MNSLGGNISFSRTIALPNLNLVVSNKKKKNNEDYV
jgi:hypothetical protein